ncbi:MAG: hypothetical protein ACRERV_01855 [Methylococcales bacterium]
MLTSTSTWCAVKPWQGLDTGEAFRNGKTAFPAQVGGLPKACLGWVRFTHHKPFNKVIY